MEEKYVVLPLSKLEKAEEVTDPEEGLLIASKIMVALSQNPNPYGLAANQIGINKRVAVFNSRGGWIQMVNPKIIRKEGTVIAFEGCESVTGSIKEHVEIGMPKKTIIDTVKTKRYGLVTISTTNQPYPILLDGSRIMEVQAAQHVIDHLDCISIMDREVKEMPYNRNDFVKLIKDNEVKILKYKKAEALIADGWVVVSKTNEFESVTSES